MGALEQHHSSLTKGCLRTSQLRTCTSELCIRATDSAARASNGDIPLTDVQNFDLGLAWSTVSGRCMGFNAAALAARRRKAALGGPMGRLF